MAKQSLVSRVYDAVRSKSSTVAGWAAKTLALDSLFGGLYGQSGSLIGFDDYLRYGTGRSWASFVACDKVGQSVKETALIVTRDKKAMEPIKNAELEALMASPNERQSWGELTYLTVVWMKLTGNAFWFKFEATKTGDRPRKLYPLNPKRVTIEVVEGKVVRYLYSMDGGGVFQIPPEFVIHFKRPHPDNDWWGIGDIEAGTELFTEFNNRQRLKNAFWRRGGVPTGVMVLDNNDVTAEEMKKFRAEFDLKYGGSADMGGKIAFLPGKWHYEKIGVDKDFVMAIDTEQWSVEQIFAVHGVPPSVAGVKIASRSGAGVQSSERSDEITYRKTTVKAMCGWLDEAITKGLIHGFDPKAFAVFNVADLIDIEAVAKACAPLFQCAALSPNDIRERCGLERSSNPELDRYFVGAGFVPIELSGIAQQEATQAAAEDAVKKQLADLAAGK